MTGRDPRILPGSSAKARTRTLWVLVWTWTAVLPVGTIAGCLAAGLHWPFHDFNLEFGVTLGFIFGLLAASIYTIVEAGFRATRRMHAEVAAGYTTLLDRYDHVDGIDAKTGAVVRPGLPVAATRHRRDGIGTGAEFGAVDLLHGPIGVVLRTPWVVIGLVASVAAGVWSFAVIATDASAPGWLVLPAVLGSLGVILFPVFGFAYVPTIRSLETLKAQFPEATIYPGASQSGDVVGELLPEDVVEVQGARDRLGGFVMCEDDRLILWSRSGTRLLPFLEIPRSRIHAAHVGSTYVGRGISTSAAVLSVTKDDDSHYDLTLGFAPSRISSPMKSAIQIDDAASWVRSWAARS